MFRKLIIIFTLIWTFIIILSYVKFAILTTNINTYNKEIIYNIMLKIKNDECDYIVPDDIFLYNITDVKNTRCNEVGYINTYCYIMELELDPFKNNILIRKNTDKVLEKIHNPQCKSLIIVYFELEKLKNSVLHLNIMFFTNVMCVIMYVALFYLNNFNIYI